MTTPIAKRLRIAKHKVLKQRRKLGIQSVKRACNWGETELALLRSHSDKHVAKVTGRTVREVATKRRSI